MSFCVLILGGSSAWTIDDWNSFFSINEIQPEEIIPNIFSWGSCNANVIPTWAPTPAITCHVYLTSEKDIVKLLDLSGKLYKDRILYFERYDSEKTNLTTDSQYNLLRNEEDVNAQQDAKYPDDARDSLPDEADLDENKETSPKALDSAEQINEISAIDHTLQPIFGDIPKPSPAANAAMSLKNKVSFGSELPRDSATLNNRISQATFSHQNINIKHPIKLVTIDSGVVTKSNQRRSMTLTTPNSNGNDAPVTDFRQILRRYQRNKDEDIDYTNYMNRNFDEMPKSGGAFKRRETYASYLQFQHLNKLRESELLTDDEKKKLLQMTPAEQVKYRAKLEKKGRLKKIRTTPDYKSLLSHQTMMDDEETLGGVTRKSALHGIDAHAQGGRDSIHLSEDDDDDDELQNAATITASFYNLGDDDDQDEESDDEKYEHSFLASDVQKKTSKKEDAAYTKHKRIHSRDHTRQKTLFDAIGSITEKLGIIQGDSRQSIYAFDNIRAATPPPILSENAEIEDFGTPRVLSVARPSVKFAEHINSVHPMMRRRSSLPENFVFGNHKRFTVNDPNSFWRTEHSFISLTALQARIVHKNPSKGLQTLQSAVFADDEYIDEDDDYLHVNDTRQMQSKSVQDPEVKFNAMMNKDYHMHEQLLPQTIIKIVKTLSLNIGRNATNALTDTGFIKCPFEFEYDTVAMFIDVSGFTKMTEILDQEGPWGGEKVAFYLNRYLEQVARIVTSEGGDILKFAGDAMIIIWPWDDDKDDDVLIDHKESMGRAIQCGLAIQKELHATQFAAGVILSVKIGIGFGKCKIVFVGGTLDRCEYLACGEPLSQAFTCENHAEPGQVIIHRSIETEIDRENFQTKWIADSDCFKVEKQKKKIRTKRGRRGRGRSNKKKKKQGGFVDAETVKRLNQFIPQAAKTRLVHRYRRWHQESRMMTVIFINLDFLAFDKLPINILQQIVEIMQVALYRYEGSLNKFMYDDKGATAVAVFGLPPICNFDDAARGVYAALQIDRVLKSLKGIQPELAEHAEEALKLKQMISTQYKDTKRFELKLRKVSIGVTSGRVYCGLLGSGGSGCEYGILGDLVNLSARLMQHAGKPKEKGGLGVDEGGVLCSKEIKIQCDDCRNLEFQKLKPIQVKGKAEHIEVFKPNYRAVLGETIIYRSRYNIGFNAEYDLIEDKVLEMIHEKGEAKGAIICVEGHHWYGGTHFAREMMARLRKYIYIVGASAIKYEETQLVVWQALMARMTRECHLLHGDEEGFKDSVYRFFNDTGMRDILPAIWVANDLLGTKFHVEPETAQSIKPEEKMNFMVEIVLHFLRIVSQYAPLLLVIVKHQFMSKDDWFITHAVCKKIKSGLLRNVSFMVTGWPQRNKAFSNRYSHRDAALCYKTFREEYCTVNNIVNISAVNNENISRADLIEKTSYIAHNDQSITVELPRWTKQEVEEFLKIEFDIKRCSPLLVKFVHNKTGGIPAMCKALVRDHHLVFVKNGGNLDCSAIERLGDLALGFKITDINFAIPASIQSYFGKMLDSLNDYQNSQFILITLKTACLICVGQEFQSLAFALDTLRACHPLFNNSDDVYFNDEFDEAIEILQFEGFIREGAVSEQHFVGSRIANFYCKEDESVMMSTKQPSFYVFCSGFARDVVYNVMLYKQRSELHRSISEVLRTYDDLLTSSHVVNSEVRNALLRHETLLQFDGMKSNFEIETEMAEKQELDDQAASDDYKQHQMALDNLSGASYDEYDLESPYPMSFGGGTQKTFALSSPYPNTAAAANQLMSSLPPSVLVVYLLRASNIPHLDAWQIPNLYITFHYGDGGKGQHLSRSVITSNSDDNDDPIWNEYAAIPLSTELLIQDFAQQKLTLKFWDYSPIRPDDDVMIGKIHIDLNDLYEEQIRAHRHLEHKLRTPRNSVAAINFQYGLKKQLEDRDYIYVEKTLRMLIDDDLKQCVPNPKQHSLFHAMFKFCVLKVNNSNHKGGASSNSAGNLVDQMEQNEMMMMTNEDLGSESRQLRTSEIMKKMNLKLHREQMSQMSDIEMNINHMPAMSQANSCLKPPLLQNYNGDNDSYFLTQLENEEEIEFDDDEFQDDANRFRDSVL